MNTHDTATGVSQLAGVEIGVYVSAVARRTLRAASYIIYIACFMVNTSTPLSLYAQPAFALQDRASVT